MEPMHKTILIVEDDPKITELIRLYLEKEEFRTLSAADGAEGVKLALQVKPDLLILDRMLPEMEGLEVLKKIRTQLDIPVLILSAKSDEIEKIIGLEVGADDYMSKPFSPKELIARVKAILRRTRAAAPQSAVLHYKDLTLDPEKLLVLQNQKPLALSALEFKLLYTLAQHVGRVFTRDQLMSEIYDSSQSIVFDRTIDAHVKNLRKKLNDPSKKPTYIASVFGVGYKLLDYESLT